MKTTPEPSPNFQGVTLITGGAGFIGTNLADRLLQLNQRVRLIDNFSRPGVLRNVAGLRSRHGSRVEVELADVCDAAAVQAAMRSVTHVFHFAAQVAVTTSLVEPEQDFEVNARGTLNVLEAARRSPCRPSVIFTSTNKVYGSLHDVPLSLRETRYRPLLASDAKGISEDHPLQFCTPHGCSKGAADQYVLDYARTFSMPATVFRLSSIYGPHQCGNEDQGWIAHFILSALRDKSITIYGDGRQVRDLLHIDDLVDAFLIGQARIHEIRGRAFNIGGGPERLISLLELIDFITEVHGARPAVNLAPARVADQRYFVSDTAGFRNATGWTPQIGNREGLVRLYRWLLENTAFAERKVPAEDPPEAFAASANPPLDQTRASA